MNRLLASMCSALMFLALSGDLTIAAEHDDSTSAEAPMGAEQEMTPEQKAMMEAWEKYATPSEGHEVLARSVGTWDAETTMWEQPDAPPMKGTAVATCKMIMGGRYLKMKFEGDYRGMPFNGMNISGFDNAEKLYHHFWVDNFGTGFYLTTGTCNEARTVCTDSGTWADPMGGGDFKVRNVMTYKDDDSMVMEMFHTRNGENERKVMQIVYTRRKAE